MLVLSVLPWNDEVASDEKVPTPPVAPLDPMACEQLGTEGAHSAFLEHRGWRDHSRGFGAGSDLEEVVLEDTPISPTTPRTRTEGRVSRELPCFARRCMCVRGGAVGTQGTPSECGASKHHPRESQIRSKAGTLEATPEAPHTEGPQSL